jgi:hypothetical protein
MAKGQRSVCRNQDSLNAVSCRMNDGISDCNLYDAGLVGDSCVVRAVSTCQVAPLAVADLGSRAAQQRCAL